MLRFCVDEDDADDELAEEHITKVKDSFHVVFVRRIVKTCVILTGVR